MSTYNGERFLREQLDSILSQQDVEISLLVRDDGSKDNTCQILSDYASKHQNVIWKSFENVGFVKSFSALIRMANTSDIAVCVFVCGCKFVTCSLMTVPLATCG